MRAPQYRQISSVLYYLAENLRRDDIILNQMDCNADSIVRSTMEYWPIDDSKEKASVRTLGQPPCLALYDVSATVGTTWENFSELVTCDLVYVFKPPVSVLDVHWRAIVSRINKLIWWRLNYYIDQKTNANFWPEQNGKTLLENACAYNVWTESREFFSSLDDNLVGFRGVLKMEHNQPPYEIPAAIPLDRINGYYTYKTDSETITNIVTATHVKA